MTRYLPIITVRDTDHQSVDLDSWSASRLQKEDRHVLASRWRIEQYFKIKGEE